MIKAIETVYNGYRFRSRLEARWAVFFDTLGIKYEYEKEGYKLPKFGSPGFLHHENTVWYLPDFWLPEQRYYIEIKGQEPSEEERAIAYQLSFETETSVAIFYGSMAIPTPAYLYGPAFHWGQSDFHWCQCPCCFKFDITWRGDLMHSKCGCIHKIWRDVSSATMPESVDERSLQAMEDGDDEAFIRLHGQSLQRTAYMSTWWQQKSRMLCFAADTPELIAAYVAARQARFEHGERG